jgi:hypothetical protein
MPVRWALTALLALAICAGPLWLWGVPLRSFDIKSDDFVYLARSRSASSLRAHLIAPHNGHIVPLFLLETHVLTLLAGLLEALPVVLSWASYATLVLSIALVGHLVAWETGRAAAGLAAMTAVGLTSVLGPALLWYSASQALAAGAMILAMLAALQAWRARQSWWLLVVAATAAVAAPLLWTAGYTAGLVGAAYLWADGRRACRRAAALPLIVSVATFAVVRVALPRLLTKPSHDSELLPHVIISPTSAAIHTAQATCEALIFNNLGLDAPTTASQAVLIVLALVALWVWTRCRFDSRSSPSSLTINPLEAAGAALVAASFGMIFAVRGIETTFVGLRTLGWYDAIAELGAVLFIAGWLSGPTKAPPPQAIEPPQQPELLIFALFAVAMLVLQRPRVDRVIYEYDGLSAPSSGDQATRTPAELVERARTQRRALAMLDRLEQSALKRGLGLAAIRLEASRVMIPGMPAGFPGVGPVELLDVPDTEINATAPDHQGNVKRHE